MAIVVDATAGNAPSSSSTWTHSHTCASGAGIFVLISVNNASDIVTGVTYNGVALSRLHAKAHVYQSKWMFIYYLANPASGANNVVISLSTNAVGIAHSVSYTGAGATQPDSTNNNNVNGSGSYSISTTTVADNCWLLAITVDDAGGSTAGANTVRRSSLSSGFGQQMWDTNAAQTPAGSKTMNMSNTFGATKWDGIVISFKPPSPVTLVGNERTPIRGVMRGTMRP